MAYGRRRCLRTAHVHVHVRGQLATGGPEEKTKGVTRTKATRRDIPVQQHSLLIVLSEEDPKKTKEMHDR